jgi:hypothetical protein
VRGIFGATPVEIMHFALGWLSMSRCLY